MSEQQRFEVILADPPWGYRDRCNAGNRGAVHKYDVMDLEALKALAVAALAAEDCALFMWATAPMLPEALEVLEAWGFRYRTIAFTWIKRTKTGKLAWGMGHYTRANPEFVLLGTRGKPKRVDAGVLSVIEAQRLAHSVKPTEVHDAIVRLMGDCSRCELFARRSAPGWAVWGNEVECDFELPVRPEGAGAEWPGPAPDPRQIVIPGCLGEEEA